MDSQALNHHFASHGHPAALSDYDRAVLRQLAEIHGTPLLVLDLEQVDRQYHALSEALPDVKLFYAVKALAHPALLARLNQLGGYFDLATAGEVNMVRDLGIAAERCIHTHPIKKDAEIREALDFGCTRFVVDNLAELEKFSPYKDQVELIVRVSFRSQDAVVDLSRKFGCAVEELPELLQAAISQQLPVKGLSFHVGSQSTSPAAHVLAVEASVEAMAQFDQIDWRWLDIGGGFPVPYQTPVMPIRDFCAPIRAALAQVPEGVEIWAEPGRFIAAPSMIELLSVMGKARRGTRMWYYLDDGVYGALSGQIFDHALYPICLLNPKEDTRYPSVLAGPTCDSIDVIDEDIDLPELEIGDLLVARMMGAYTLASATEFNFYPKPQVVVMEGLR